MLRKTLSSATSTPFAVRRMQVDGTQWEITISLPLSVGGHAVRFVYNRNSFVFLAKILRRVTASNLSVVCRSVLDSFNPSSNTTKAFRKRCRKKIFYSLNHFRNVTSKEENKEAIFHSEVNKVWQTTTPLQSCLLFLMAVSVNFTLTVTQPDCAGALPL